MRSRSPSAEAAGRSRERAGRRRPAQSRRTPRPGAQSARQDQNSSVAYWCRGKRPHLGRLAVADMKDLYLLVLDTLALAPRPERGEGADVLVVADRPGTPRYEPPKPCGLASAKRAPGSSPGAILKMRRLLSPIACRWARIAAMVRADRHDHGRGWRRSSRGPGCRPRHRGRRQRDSLAASEAACTART